MASRISVKCARVGGLKLPPITTILLSSFVIFFQSFYYYVYLVVVESQLRHFVQGKPPHISGVILTLHLLHPHPSIVGNGDPKMTQSVVTHGWWYL